MLSSYSFSSTSLVQITVVSLANLHKRPKALACYYVTSYWQAEWVKKLRWNPPVQKSVAPESYLESVKIQLAEIKPIKPKNNLSHNEYKALTELKKNTNIVLKKADKGTTTVIMNMIKYKKVTFNSTTENIINLSEIP